MSKYRFREYDALGINRNVPGDKVASLHHISKHKQKKKDVEVVFDVKDYKEYVTGFRKRKQQRRQDALRQIKEKQRQERNQKRLEKRAKLKEDLGLGDDYGIGSSSDDDEEKNSEPQPQSVTVYRGEGGMTTTVTTMALQSSDDEQLGEASSSGDDDEEEEGAADSNGTWEGGDAATGQGPSSGSRGNLLAGSNNGGGRNVSKHGAGRQKVKSKQADKPGGAKQSQVKPPGGMGKAGKRGAVKHRVR